jgi:AcrR family transcriptional regulator
VSTRARIIAATVDTLREDGFGAASARSIASRGGFNQALIFYHFGSITDLLVATLEDVGADRLAEYRGAAQRISGLTSAIEVAQRQYARDVSAGHITVLAELVAGASSVPELGPEIVRCMEPWIAFAEDTIRSLLTDTPFESLLPPRDAAMALLSLYLGMELLDHLDPGAGVSRPLFRLATQLAQVVEPVLATGDRYTASARSRPRRRAPVLRSASEDNPQ